MAPGMSLKGSAAAAFNQLSTFHFATLGTPLCVTGGYRTYQRQVELYAEKPELAAVPGTSEHGWGNAVDLCGGIELTDTEAHRWMQAHAADFGWFHPAWAEPTGSKPEPWHWEFNG
jgi:LAS superfamily LD-carboxypeptidase LdcB